jgi:sugar-specific transcriptional regulator TrmB
LFAKLGLTSLQARVYLTLVNIGEATAKAISVQAEMDRADVYRVIETLQEQSLVEKIISTPVKFKAVTLREGLSILLERKQNESAETEKQASLLLEQYHDKETEINRLENPAKFSIVPPKETRTLFFLKLLNNAQSMDAIVPQHFERNWSKLEGHIKEFLRKGGKCRVMISHVKKQEEIHQLNGFREFTDSCFQIRYTASNLLAAFAIFNKKELLINTLPAIGTYEQPNLLTNSPVILDLALSYFEREWKEASSLKLH